RRREFWLRLEKIALNLETERSVLVAQNRCRRTGDGRDVLCWRGAVYRKFGQRAPVPSKGIGQAWLRFLYRYKNTPPWMASPRTHCEIVGTCGWQLTGTSAHARRIVGKRWVDKAGVIRFPSSGLLNCLQ